MKNMELNQERLIVDHDKKMESMHTKLLAIEEKRVEELGTIKENHKKEMSSMQDRDVNLQNKLLAMKKQHAEEVKTMESNHADQMSIMRA